MKNTGPILTAAILISIVFLAGADAAVKPLVDAASRGDIAIVRELLRTGTDVNEAQGDGMTALHWAAERGDTELAAALIFAGSNVAAGTRIGQYTPLHIASRNGRAETVSLLLEAGAEADARTSNSGATALHLAAASGSAAATRALLAAGAEVNAIEQAWGQTPLIFAAAANRVAVINALLKAGADSSATSRSINTTDMEKADKASEKRLSEFLADFKAKEGGGVNWQPQPSQVQAAIEAAREIQRKWPDVPDPSCDDYVADASDDAEVTNKCAASVTYNADGEPMYDYATDEDDSDEPKLASYGQQVGSWGGLAALHHAVRQGHTEAILALLAGGADIDQPIDGGRSSPLLVAAINGQFDVALLLLEKGANPNLTSSIGTSPLFAVLERQWAPRASYAHPVEHRQQVATHLDVMRALLQAGADPNIRLEARLWFAEYTFAVLGAAGVHYKGATPFWRATNALDLPAMQLLLEYGANADMPTVKLPPRPKRRPDPKKEIKAEIEAGNAKKTLAAATASELASDVQSEPQTPATEEDQSGLPEIPVGGPFIYPLHVAAGAGYGQQFAGNAHQHVPGNWLNTVKFLLEECGAEVNLRDANGYTALHHAASRGDNEMVKYLIERGADVMVVSRKGQTTVDMANGPIQRLAPFPETIALLESFGAINNNRCVSC